MKIGGAPTKGRDGSTAGFENKVAFIWKIADKLRGNLKPHEYGPVMLPTLVLFRVDAVLEPTTPAVLAAVYVPLPPISDQVAAVADTNRAVAAERTATGIIARSIALFEEPKRSLITAAVTGEFDVSSADGSRVPIG